MGGGEKSIFFFEDALSRADSADKLSNLCELNIDYFCLAIKRVTSWISGNCAWFVKNCHSAPISVNTYLEWLHEGAMLTVKDEKAPPVVASASCIQTVCAELRRRFDKNGEEGFNIVRKALRNCLVERLIKIQAKKFPGSENSLGSIQQLSLSFAAKVKLYALLELYGEKSEVNSLLLNAICNDAGASRQRHATNREKKNSKTTEQIIDIAEMDVSGSDIAERGKQRLQMVFAPDCNIEIEQEIHRQLLTPEEQALIVWHRLAARTAAEGERDRHRHGAILAVNPSRVEAIIRELETPERFCEAVSFIGKCDPEDLVVSVGINTPWKIYESKISSQSKRRKLDGDSCEAYTWKIEHAEMATLAQAVHDRRVRCCLLDPIAGTDWQTALSHHGKEAQNQTPRGMANAMSEFLDIAESLDLKLGSSVLDVLIVELHENGVSFDASQPCPMCTKGLLRWGIGRSIFSLPDAKLLGVENLVESKNPQLSCEALGTFLDAYARKC